MTAVVDAIKRCSGVTEAGPCNVPPDLLQPDEAGALWCFSHHPELAEERQLARERGGQRRGAQQRRHRYLHDDELGTLGSAADAKRWAEAIARGVATGR